MLHSLSYYLKRPPFSWIIPSSLLKWLGINTINERPLDPVFEYIKKKLQRFNDSYNNKVNFSRNIESDIYDKVCFKEVLFYPENYLEKAWKRRILVENSPRGNIVMYYDIYKHGFAYYSSQSGIPYAILNAVAMKYVLTFYCRDFYMDETTMPKDVTSPLIKVFYDDNDEEEKRKKREKNNIPEIDVKHGPFAKFKDYSKNTVKVPSIATKKKHSFFEYIQQLFYSFMGCKVKTIDPIVQLEKAPMSKEKMINKFVYLGHTNNWKPLQTPIKNIYNGKQVSTQYDTMFSNTRRLSYTDWIKVNHDNEI